tara:strand:- start:156 stop:638 length:483 start_codon:yes stop_codon:yes gene_type:complete
MQNDKLIRFQSLQMVYEQNWLHFRHVENERLWFTNIFALIVAGTFVFAAESGLRHELWPLFLILVIVSLLGLQITIRLSWTALSLSNHIQAIADELGISAIEGIPVRRDSQESGLLARIRRSAQFLFTVASAFMLFYLMMFGVVLGLLIYTIKLNTVSVA